MSGALMTAGRRDRGARRAVVRHLGIREAAAFSVCSGRHDRAVRPAAYGRRPTTAARYRVDTTPPGNRRRRPLRGRARRGRQAGRSGVPIEHLVIVGCHPQVVETVTGRLDAWRALAAGARSVATLPTRCRRSRGSRLARLLRSERARRTVPTWKSSSRSSALPGGRWPSSAFGGGRWPPRRPVELGLRPFGASRVNWASWPSAPTSSRLRSR